MSQNDRSIRPEVFYKTANLKKIAKFARKHLCWSHGFDKLAGFFSNFIRKTPVLVLRREFDEIFQNIL